MDLKYKIGYIDEDNAQVKLYKRKLRDHGFEVIGYDFAKGMTVGELMEQVYNSDIDLLMIDFRLNESNIIAFNGDEVERHIYNNKPLFPHIIFTNKIDQAEPDVDDLKIIVDKESAFPDGETSDSVNVKRFVDLLTKSIDQYKNYVADKKNVISSLLEKEKKNELNARDKDLLISTQRELQILDKTKSKEVPEQLVSVESLDKLTRATKEAEAYIKSLIEKHDKNDG